MVADRSWEALLLCRQINRVILHRAALHGLTMSISRQLGKRDICVNTVLPGPMIRYQRLVRRNAYVSLKKPFESSCKTEDIAHVMAQMTRKWSYMSASIIDMTCGSMKDIKMWFMTLSTKSDTRSNAQWSNWKRSVQWGGWSQPQCFGLHVEICCMERTKQTEIIMRKECHWSRQQLTRK